VCSVACSDATELGVHHFFVTPDDVAGDRIVLRGEEAHHAARVLRVRQGERVTVADGTGRVFDGFVRSFGDSVEVDVVDVRNVSLPRPSITIHQALMKGDRMDDMIEKSVEIGVARIVPFVAERSIVRWDDPKREKAHERWTHIARAAAKQSRSAWLTEIAPIASGVPKGPAFVLHEEATVRLRDVLPDEPPATVELVVGPEGGLAPDETLELGGSTLVSLGPRILRTEVAGPVAAAMIAFAYGNLG
jgi:16S rRNA (uracil1498-N3)-methyltransferase